MKGIDTCPDCGPAAEMDLHAAVDQPHLIPRREFLKTVTKASAVVAAAPLIVIAPPAIARGPQEKAETLVRQLRESLTAAQREAVILPWTDPRRLRVENNWRVVPQEIGEFYSKEQQEIIRGVVAGVASEEGYDKIMRAMRDDMGGLGNYSACLFSDSGDKLAFMLTGRHQTIRAEGGWEKNAVFGGPIFYGHAVEFYEKPDHPGNVWWHQARLASKVYHALDGKQQEKALVRLGAPPDSRSSIKLQGRDGSFAGVSVSELSRDQKNLLEEVMRALLEPYRQSDVDEAIASLKANGGMDQLYLSFYQDGDLPDEHGIWDRWKLEGPSFVWYFRGSPHVHTWINIAHETERGT